MPRKRKSYLVTPRPLNPNIEELAEWLIDNATLIRVPREAVELMRSEGLSIGFCWATHLSLDRHGYGQVGRPAVGDYPAMMRCHRVAYEGIIGPVPDGYDLAHLCGNPPCIRPYHMKPKTRKQNHQDMIAHGRATRGEDNTEVILTEDQVADIWYSYKPGDITQQELADRHGVSRRLVSMILTGDRWGHLTSELPPGGGKKFVRSRDVHKLYKDPSKASNKLTAKQVRRIWMRRRRGEPVLSLARKNNVSEGCVEAIIAGRTWRRVTSNLPPM